MITKACRVESLNLGLRLLDAPRSPAYPPLVRPACLFIALLLSIGCRPDYLCSVRDRPGSRDLRAAADRLAEAMTRGAPETDDGPLFAELIRAAEGSRAHGASDAELAALGAAYLREAGARFTSDGARSAARERALRGARRWVLPGHPEAARYLR